ncbi:MAG: Ribonuclease G [Chlamydiales bacterium]|nr:Ribonuclease G [Chlamydiales bacterium]MCH9635550.1 Ribonuclease G [Chlamydiales bacterium]MCH9703901.1 Rne/Rng family ribonuclease [Chlamydiota bacterium]
MDNDVLLNIESKEIRYAHLKNGQLVNLTVERKKSRQLTGNIYRGRVKNILKNIQSAFIDIGEGENGFIHMADIIENTKKFEQNFDMDFDIEVKKKKSKKSPEKIEQLLKSDQPVLVQVVKESIGTKGARLTSNVSIAGRYLVLLPNSPHRGVSRKIEDRSARDRLKKVIRAFEMPQDLGLICRTASVHATTDMLIDEANELFEAWHTIREKFNDTTNPSLLYEESDIVKRAVITCIDKKFDRLLVDDYSTYQRCKRIYKKFSGEHQMRIEYFRDKTPMFERFNVEKEIEKATRRKVWLNSGGYLFFDRTEAMHTIDINSGRSSIGKDKNVEEALMQINLEAAAEIARQLRIRNMGGLVIVDFIDMRYRKNQRKVVERLKECMKEDPAKGTILNMSDFGLVEMTRQRHRESLEQTLLNFCPYCSGIGQIKSHETVSIEIERVLKKVTNQLQHYGLRLTVHPDLYKYMESDGEFEYLDKLARDLKARIEFDSDDTLHLNDYRFYSTVANQPIEI